MKNTGRLKNRQNKGITLIALIITILVLLILAGVSINMVLGQNGLLEKTKLAKDKTEYMNAKEKITIELMNIRAQCMADETEYNIIEISQKIKNVDEITIEKYYYSEENLEAIVVSVNEYSKYKFLLGKEGDIIGVSQQIVNDDTKQEQFKNIEDFEKNNFGQKIDVSEDKENDKNKVISYVFNSKILDDENNRYTQLTDTTGNNNNANVNSINSNDEKNGIIFDGVSNFATVDLKQKLVFPLTIEMMIQTSTENRPEVFYIDSNTGICFGSWGTYFIFTANTARQVCPIPSNFYDGNLKHIVVTYNSLDEFSFYINGEKQNMSGGIDYYRSDGDGFYIGARASGNLFKGILYNFRIYNKILSQDEINASYNNDKRFLENNGTAMDRQNLILEYTIKNNNSNIYTKFKTNRIFDRSNHHNNAIAHNITYYDNKDGGIFDGTSGYVTVNLKDALKFPLTVEMVVKTSTENRVELFYMEPNVGISFGSWGTYFIFTANNARQVCPIPSNFYDGNLKHIVVTYNSIDEFSFYINGEKQSMSGGTDYFNSDGDGTFYIGARARGHHFKGDMYEFNIYNTILDENEIVNKYQKSLKYKEN